MTTPMVRVTQALIEADQEDDKKQRFTQIVIEADWNPEEPATDSDRPRIMWLERADTL